MVKDQYISVFFLLKASLTGTGQLELSLAIFLEKIYGDKENNIVMDSHNMEEGWKDQMYKVNPNSEYDWDRVSDEMRDIENEYHI